MVRAQACFGTVNKGGQREGWDSGRYQQRGFFIVCQAWLYGVCHASAHPGLPSGPAYTALQYRGSGDPGSCGGWD